MRQCVSEHGAHILAAERLTLSWSPLLRTSEFRLLTEDNVTPIDADAILTRDEVAAWLKVRPRQVERLRIPHIDLGRKTKRYLRTEVLAWLHAKRSAVAAT
jgi:hypothetical protein